MELSVPFDRNYLHFFWIKIYKIASVSPEIEDIPDNKKSNPELHWKTASNLTRFGKLRVSKSWIIFLMRHKLKILIGRYYLLQNDTGN